VSALSVEAIWSRQSEDDANMQGDFIEAYYRGRMEFQLTGRATILGLDITGWQHTKHYLKDDPRAQGHPEILYSQIPCAYAEREITRLTVTVMTQPRGERTDADQR
jgi:hypothetical protein